MKLIDTVVLMGFLNPKDSLHGRAVAHLRRVHSDDEVFVPATSLFEADLVMKLRGYTDVERLTSWEALEGEIPTEKVVRCSASSIGQAAVLQEEGMDYFDSLICALAAETGSAVVTTDKEIGNTVETEW